MSTMAVGEEDPAEDEGGMTSMAIGEEEPPAEEEGGMSTMAVGEEEPPEESGPGGGEGPFGSF